MSASSRFGDAFTLDVAGNGRFVMLADPEVVREVFRGDPDVLHSGEANELFAATVGRQLGPGARRGPARPAAPRPGPAPERGTDAGVLRCDAAETLEAVRAWPVGIAVPRPAPRCGGSRSG